MSVITVLSLIACAAEDDGGADTVAPASDTAQSAVQGMQGMQGRGGMMEQMQFHMRMIEGAGADSMQAMLPMHRQIVANMISQFNREMREMNMPGNAGWEATIDSLRQDNIRMPKMSATELGGFMPEHRARVTRLMEMHRSMMGNMSMRSDPGGRVAWGGRLDLWQIGAPGTQGVGNGWNLTTRNARREYDNGTARG